MTFRCRLSNEGGNLVRHQTHVDKPSDFTNLQENKELTCAHLERKLLVISTIGTHSLKSEALFLVRTNLFERISLKPNFSRADYKF